jgi:hypothetical protein
MVVSLKENEFEYRTDGHLQNVLCKGTYLLNDKEVVFNTNILEDSDSTYTCDSFPVKKRIQFCKPLESGIINGDTLFFKGNIFVSHNTLPRVK